jgi:site-specific DNA recombinase
MTSTRRGPLTRLSVYLRSCSLTAAAGLITCPACGHSYVGTSATGRTRTYRLLHLLLPRPLRPPRLPADETDDAVLQALCDFYAHSTSLIQDAATRAQQRHRDGHASQRAEHAAILAPIKHKVAAIDRYHAAFENGTMDDATAGQRLKTLHDQIAQLTIRTEELTDALARELVPPPAGVIADLQAYLANAITSGTPASAKPPSKPSSPKSASPTTGSSPCFGSQASGRRSPATRTPPQPKPRFAQC